MSDTGRRHVQIADNGRLLGSADVQLLDEPGDATASLHLEPGPLPPGTHARLVDAVLDVPGVEQDGEIHVGVPRGDTQILDRVRERFTDVESHAAGGSVIINASHRASADGAPTA